MARPKNPARRNELLARMVEHLGDKPLSGVTFRTLADALDVSTYVLVYHFGNREQLVHEIVVAIDARDEELKRSDVGNWTRDQYRAWLDDVWQWIVHERTRPLRRLGLEAAMQDLVALNPVGTAPQYFAHWVDHVRTWLVSQGVEPRHAQADARLLVAGIYGLSYDQLINGDTDAATAAFEAMVRSFWRTIDERLAG